MTQYGYTLLGLTAMVAMLVAVLTFAVLKFVAGARPSRTGCLKRSCSGTRRAPSPEPSGGSQGGSRRHTGERSS